MKDLMGLMKSAQAMQGKMQEAQAELERLEVEGQSGAGLVRVTLTAKGQMKALAIDPSLLKADEGRSSKTSSSPRTRTRAARPSAWRRRRCATSPPACRCRPG